MARMGIQKLTTIWISVNIGFPNEVLEMTIPHFSSSLPIPGWEEKRIDQPGAKRPRLTGTN